MEKIQIAAFVQAPVAHVWKTYNTPTDIQQWNQASPEWFCPSSENDLQVGGKFKNRMEAKDGSFGFDFEGEYTEVTPFQSIAYKMADGRNTTILFSNKENYTQIDITFDAEEINPIEMQKQGWQAILNSFKTYAEQTYEQQN